MRSILVSLVLVSSLLWSAAGMSQAALQQRLEDIINLYYDSYGRSADAPTMKEGVDAVTNYLLNGWSIDEVETTAWRILNEVPEAATRPFGELFREKATLWGKPGAAQPQPAAQPAPQPQPTAQPQPAVQPEAQPQPTPEPQPAAQPQPAPQPAPVIPEPAATEDKPWVVADPAAPPPAPAVQESPPGAYSKWHMSTYKWGQKRFAKRIVLGTIGTVLLVISNEALSPTICAVNDTARPGTVCSRTGPRGFPVTVRGYNSTGHLPWGEAGAASPDVAVGGTFTDLMLTFGLEVFLPSLVGQFPGLIAASTGLPRYPVQAVNSFVSAVTWWFTAALQLNRWGRLFVVTPEESLTVGAGYGFPGVMVMGAGVTAFACGIANFVGGFKAIDKSRTLGSESLEGPRVAFEPWVAPGADGVSAGFQLSF